MRKRIMIGSVLLVFALLLFSPTHSTALIIELNYVFSGNSPSGSAPWLRATFENVSGGVQLTLENLLQDPSEFLAGANLSKPQKSDFGWGFNFNPSLDLASLTINPTGTGTNDADLYLKGADAFKADGDGYFDILFAWDQPPASRFKMGETAVYLIAGISGLADNDFAFTSVNGGGEGVYRSAAHVQGIPILDDPNNTNSAWIGDGGAPVPEPATMFLLGTGLIGVGAFARRKFKK